MNELERAIVTYSDMLPYPNEGYNPNDDARLYKIAYAAYKMNLDIPKDFFIEQLRKNEVAGLDNLDVNCFNKFFDKILQRINEAIYIFEKAEVKK